MTKTIEIVLAKRSVGVVAEMHVDLAPRTCEAIWNALPHEGVAIHAKFSGNQIFTVAKESPTLKQIPRENLTIYPLPRDVMYNYFPPAWEGGVRGTREGACQIMIWYGPDSPTYQPDGPHPFNHFATIVGDMNKFAEECRALRQEGAQKILIKRA